MNQITTAVIPAAGLGTRMRPLTGGGSKELLAVAGKPALAHAFAEARLAGCEAAVVILSRAKHGMAKTLPGHAPEGMRLIFEMQAHPHGECDAIALAAPHVGKAPFAVIYPDNIAHPPGALDACARTLERTGLDTVALMRVEDGHIPGLSNSGRVDTDRADNGEYLVTAFHPKGPGTFSPRFPGEMRTCGIYAALPHYFEFIEQARAGLKPGEELTDGKVRRLMLDKGVEFAGTPLPGTVYGIGTPEGYRICRRDLES
jgi:UTP--glucose-1-phosphate uridylyltransferase